MNPGESMKTRWTLIYLIVITILSLTYSVALAADETPWQQENTPRQPTDDEVNAIAKQLYCPVCENIPLDVCPTLACEQWRGVIRDKLVAGWNEEQIKTYFVDQYGDRVLATPPVRGLNWLVYVIPPLVILAGVFLLYRAFSAWRKPVEESSMEVGMASSDSQTDSSLDDYSARLEDELRKRQAGRQTTFKKGES